MGGRARRGASGRRAAEQAWSWGWRTIVLTAAVVCGALSIDDDTPQSPHSPRGIASVGLLSTAGVPLGRLVRIDIVPLWWVAHVLFWIPVLSWVLSWLGRGRGRGAARGPGHAARRLLGRRHRAARRSGNPSVRQAALKRERRS